MITPRRFVLKELEEAPRDEHLLKKSALAYFVDGLNVFMLLFTA